MDSHKNSPASHFLAAIYGSRSYIVSIIDMAQLFSKQGGARASIITTPVNATHVSKLFERTRKVDILAIKFPCVEVGLPEGCGSLDIAVSSKMKQKFF
ncbi:GLYCOSYLTRANSFERASE [Salix purpurea]|uniref:GLYCOSYLTRANSFERASE n=1 Tax=Salix purpurea TaxID=77065 RepID=A0A9Q0SJ36_SALPP|nr:GLYCOSYLTRANSFERASE [Salix purpurea]